MVRKSLMLFVMVLLFVYALPISAQLTGATISGVVEDATGARVPGVSIEVRNVETGVNRTTTTDDQGRYSAPNLISGPYQVTASLSGFQTAVRSGITLSIGREAVVNLELQVGAVVEQVEVTGEAPLVNTTTAAVGELVNEQEILELPLNGRSFEQLALLEPGVIFARGSSSDPGAGRGAGGRKISIAGTRPEYTTFRLDGADLIDARAKTPGSAAGVSLGVESLREFRVVTNPFTAEYARVAGGVVNAVTKSGTNQLHGSAFWFLRNDNLDAKNFFDVQDQPIPEFRRNQFGGALGGPIVRDKTFFFGSYEGLREQKGQTGSILVPTAGARQGIGVLDPGEEVDPAVLPYLDFFPLPNGDILSDGVRGQFIGATDRVIGEDFLTVRIDHQLTDSDFLTGRYRLSDSSVISPSLIPSVIENTDLMRKQVATLEHTRLFSSTVLNAVNFTFSRSAPVDGFEAETVPEELQFLPGRADHTGTITTTGLSSLGPPHTGPPLKLLVNVWQLNDNLSVTKGAHSMKMGANIYRFQYNGNTSSRMFGRYSFRSLGDFLTTNVNQFQFLVDPGSSAPRGARSSIIGFYFQDDWKALPNLTLNLGVRYEFFTTPTEAHGRVSNLRFLMDEDLTVGDPFIDNPSLDQFAPRIGFAWDPFGDGKTSVRGGAGLFYANPTSYGYYSMFQQNPPFYQIGALRGRAAAFPQATVEGVSPTPSFVFGFQFDMDTAYITQWGLQVQRDLGGQTVLNIGYTASRGVHLARMIDNTAIPEILPDGRKFFAPRSPRRNRNFGTLRYRASDANSFYHGLTFSLTKRYSAGLQFRTAYTFSKAIDEASSQGESADWDNAGGPFSLDTDDVHRDRGLSAFHTLNNLSMSSTYDLPFGSGPLGGWQVGGIFSASSGVPVAVTTGFSRSRNGARGSGVMDRPDLAPGASNNPVLGNTAKRLKASRTAPYFDATAFELPEAGFYGNLARQTLIGPGRVSFDLSLLKDTRVSEGLNVQFRAEFFNVFNRANFGIPDADIYDSRARSSDDRLDSAGIIDSTSTDSRQIQFSLKFLF